MISCYTKCSALGAQCPGTEQRVLLDWVCAGRTSHTDAEKEFTHMMAWLTQTKQGMMLHQRPAVVIQAVVLVDQELTHISGRHVSRDLHNFSHTILTENFDDLFKTHTQNVNCRCVHC